MLGDRIESVTELEDLRLLVVEAADAMESAGLRTFGCKSPGTRGVVAISDSAGVGMDMGVGAAARSSCVDGRIDG